MGFFDSMNKAFEDGQKQSAERMSNSRYRTAIEADNDLYNKYDSMGESELLNKYKSSFTNDNDKPVIESILISRGYTKQGSNFRKL